MRETRGYIACTGARSLSSAKCTFIAASRIIGVRFVLANETETRLASKSFNFDGIYSRREPIFHLSAAAIATAAADTSRQLSQRAFSLDSLPGVVIKLPLPSVWNK